MAMTMKPVCKANAKRACESSQSERVLTVRYVRSAADGTPFSM
jgi:hypothetical protein